MFDENWGDVTHQICPLCRLTVPQVLAHQDFPMESQIKPPQLWDDGAKCPIDVGNNETVRKAELILAFCKGQFSIPSSGLFQPVLPLSSSDWASIEGALRLMARGRLNALTVPMRDWRIQVGWLSYAKASDTQRCRAPKLEMIITTLMIRAHVSPHTHRDSMPNKRHYLVTVPPHPCKWYLLTIQLIVEVSNIK